MNSQHENMLHGHQATSDLVSNEPTAPELMTLARRIGAVRGARKDIFPAGQFGEPGWDMIFALYLAAVRGEELNVSNVCEVSDAPPTTALRWLERLLELKMIRRRKHPTDNRVAFIELELETSKLVEAFLREAWATFYPQM
jgi:DNA-binding MarR family transcriptional regulator